MMQIKRTGNSISKHVGLPRARRPWAMRMLMFMPLLCLLAMIGACNTDDVAYLQCRDMNGWDRNNALEFDLSSLDTMPGHTADTRYVMSLTLRIDHSYTYSTLPILMEIESPKAKSFTDTLNIPIPSASKRTQSVGGISSIDYPVSESFPLPPNCRITLSQVSNKDKLEGIISVGLLLKEKKNNK